MCTEGVANADRNVLLFVLYSIGMDPCQGETMIHCGRIGMPTTKYKMRYYNLCFTSLNCDLGCGETASTCFLVPASYCPR